MIGIIGYGYVGKAVEHAFMCDAIICDPKYNERTIDDLLDYNLNAIFVCVPTPDDEPNFNTALSVIDSLERSNYDGLIIVKSTILPQYLKGRDVVYNPEFLTQRNNIEDFLFPELLVFGGDRAMQAKKLYEKYSNVTTDNVFITTNETACLLKYTMNCFYGLKVCYMNHIKTIADKCGADYNQMTDMLRCHPWMGNNHFDVPGPDGKKGFGGACLPKDMRMFEDEYGTKLLELVLRTNKKQRHS